MRKRSRKLTRAAFVESVTLSRWKPIAREQGKLDLAVILDLFSRMVVGSALSAANDPSRSRAGTAAPLPRGRAPPSHRSGQPVRKRGLPARARRTRHHLQHEPAGQCARHRCDEELVLDAEAKTKLFDYVEVFYNQERKHPTLRYLSPAQFGRAARVEQAPA